MDPNVDCAKAAPVVRPNTAVRPMIVRARNPASLENILVRICITPHPCCRYFVVRRLREKPRDGCNGPLQTPSYDGRDVVSEPWTSERLAQMLGTSGTGAGKLLG